MESPFINHKFDPTLFRMDGPKRHAFCTANGIPFDALLYSTTTWTQNSGKRIPKDRDWDVYVGTVIPVPVLTGDPLLGTGVPVPVDPTAPSDVQPSAPPACPQEDLPPPSYDEIVNT